ncbi:hypothetical protein CRUP_035504 [Coryphaenoides rupestris]|nr:hypothetical protein CRUP_035504 [Coryphaenoides rupestris]
MSRMAASPAAERSRPSSPSRNSMAVKSAPPTPTMMMDMGRREALTMALRGLAGEAGHVVDDGEKLVGRRASPGADTAGRHSGSDLENTSMSIRLWQGATLQHHLEPQTGAPASRTTYLLLLRPPHLPAVLVHS